MGQGVPSIFELAHEANQLIAKILQNGGEIDAEIEALLLQNEAALAQKTDAYAFAIDRIEAESEFWAEEAEARAKVSKALAKVAKRLKDRVKQAMIEGQLEELTGRDYRYKLTLQKKPKLVIDEAALNRDFKMQEVKWIPDVERIQAALEKGEVVSGVTQEPSYRLNRYLNKGGSK